MGETITTIFVGLLIFGPLILGALYYIFIGALNVLEAIVGFFDTITEPFTKEGKASRKRAKNIKNFEKLFKKLRNFKNRSELPDDTVLLKKLAERFEKEGDPGRGLICYRKSSDLGCELGSYHAARLLWKSAAGSIEVLKEVERYAQLSVERRGTDAETSLAGIRRSSAGAAACCSRCWSC